MTNANIWREFRWKVIMRYFRTPQITAKWVLTTSDKCWRNCGPQNGNHTHIFWSCPKLSIFWNEVLDALREIFHQNIPNDPRVVLLGSIPEGFEGRAKIYLLQILLGAAIKCITIRWLKPEPPTYNIWLKKVWELYEMEQITYAIRLQRPIFIKRWSPVMSLLMQ